MDNKEVKRFNKKLLIAFITVLTIFSILLLKNIRVDAVVKKEIESYSQGDLAEPPYITVDMLNGRYDILCCEKGAPLPGNGYVKLFAKCKDVRGNVNEDVSNWSLKDFGVERGKHPVELNYYGNGHDFISWTTYTRTHAKFTIKKSHTALPHEAYILAEMKNEAGLGEENVSAEFVYDEDGNLKPFVGTMDSTIIQETVNGESVYTVNQKYVLKTSKGIYYVTLARDDEGNSYYVYDDNFKEYTGNLKDGEPVYELPGTGEEIVCLGVNVDNVYYLENGELIIGDKYPRSGKLYLVDFDTVIKKDEQYYYCESNGSGYIQIAWWKTLSGSTGKGSEKLLPNGLYSEAVEFENYIKKITGSKEIDVDSFKEQSHLDENGKKVSVPAPVIDYKPGFDENIDGDEAEKIEDFERVTVAFDNTKQAYVVGPFKLKYTYYGVKAKDRAPVVFSEITGAKLETNLKDLELGKEWNFKYLSDHKEESKQYLSDATIDYKYPFPNEVFYIEINYIENLTEITDFSFNFRYMNAGARFDVYEGTYIEANWKPYSSLKHEIKDTDNDGINDYDKWVGETWLRAYNVGESHAQTQAHALIGARWYNYAECHKRFGLHSATLTVKKTTYDETGKEIVPIDRTFQFKIYVDYDGGTNYKEFQDLTVTTKNGFGSAKSQRIAWKDTEKENGDIELAPIPTYKIVEIGEVSNDGPWEGTLTDKSNISVEANNYMTPNKGWLEIDKKLINPTPALENEVFKFKVAMHGTFAYETQFDELRQYSAAEPFLIELTIKGAGSWQSEAFKWYGDAPSYTVEEIIDENATYELVDGKIQNGNNYLVNKRTQKAIATNQSTLVEKTLHIDKKMISETSPKSGEVFEATVVLKGKFSYDGDEITDRVLEIPVRLQEKEYTKPDDEAFIDFGTCKDWKWDSKKIVWNKKDSAPEYTVKEVKMAEGTELLSISNEEMTGTVNNFTAKLNTEDDSFVTITNERTKPLIGRLQINKLVETEDLYGKEFTFRVQVSGKFKYYEEINGKIELISENEYNQDKTIKFPTKEELAANKKYSGTWYSGIFAWDVNDEAPTYTVEEIKLPEGSEFVSISNEAKTERYAKKIEGSLIGVKSEKTMDEYETLDYINAGRVNVNCVNRGIGKYGRIVIVKQSDYEIADGKPFEFKVTISGNFDYAVNENVDVTSPNAQFRTYNEETGPLVLTGAVDGVTAVCALHDWQSHMIRWGANTPAPNFTVEEINIPEDYEFVYMRNAYGYETRTPYLEGMLTEGVQNNYIFAKNNPTNDIPALLRIIKKADDSLSNKKFEFEVKITSTGKFTYGGVDYGPGTENGDTLVIPDISVIANGPSWDLPEILKWDENNPEPTYTVKETKLPEGSKFISISKEFLDEGDKDSSDWICTDPEVREISGKLHKDRVVVVEAVNQGSTTIPAQIRIIKNVLNSDLKNKPFHFKVEVTSESPFRYFPRENPTEPIKYAAGATWVCEDAVAYADSEDYFSGIFMWDDDAAIPTYTISEITNLFDDGVYTVSIRNNSGELYFDKLDNKSGKDFVIKGSLENVGLTTIWAENTKDENTSLRIRKVSKTITDKVYHVNLTVKGDFEYNGKHYKPDSAYTVEIPLVTNGPAWESGEFKWENGKEAPIWTVKEIEADEFVSISKDKLDKGEKPSDWICTDKKSREISGRIDKNNTITIEAKNEEDKREGSLQILKKSTTLNGTYHVNLKVEGEFDYKGVHYGSGSAYIEDNIEIVANGEPWKSEIFKWDVGKEAPKYTVQEIEADKFESISKDIIDSDDTKTSDWICTDKDVRTISGSLHEYRTVTVEVKNEEYKRNGSIIIRKKSSTLDGRTYHVNLKVEGEFDYQGVHYGPDSAYIEDNIAIVANGPDWVSEIFEWEEGKEAPKFTVQEVEADNFVSIRKSIAESTDKKSDVVCTDKNTRTIKGKLHKDNVVVIDVINDVESGNIKIIKEVNSKDIENEVFHFRVEVTSKSQFEYYELGTTTAPKTVKAGETLVFEDLPITAISDGWTSGKFEWNKGDETPTFKVCEISKLLPDKVKTESIRVGDTMVSKELDNTSNENLEITGSIKDRETVIITAKNKKDKEPLCAKLQLEKRAANKLIEGEEFTFLFEINGKFTYDGKPYETYSDKVTLVAKGPNWVPGTVDENKEIWLSKLIEWDEEDGAPVYTVTEETATFYDRGIKFVSITNGHKTETEPLISSPLDGDINITHPKINWVTATNTKVEEYVSGQIQLTKIAVDENGNKIKGKEFNFKLTVTYSDGKVEEETLTVKAGDSDTNPDTNPDVARSKDYKWLKGTPAPKYHLEEDKNNKYTCVIDKPDGELEAKDPENKITGIISIIAQNTETKSHKADIEVLKILNIEDKISPDDVKDKFNALVTVTGDDFSYKGESYNKDKPLKIDITLECFKDENGKVDEKRSWKWKSSEITWLDGVNAPTFTVEEPTDKIPVGWNYEGIETSNVLVDGTTAEAKITNHWKPDEKLWLTMELGGRVWDDTNRKDGKDIDTLENGVIDDGETGIENIKVTIYRALVDKETGKFEKRLEGVYAYDDNDVAVPLKDNVRYTEKER